MRKGDTMGLVIAANYRDVEVQMANGEKLNTVNMSVRHYLKIMRAWNAINKNLIIRNLTLEDGLLNSTPNTQEDFRSGRIDRLRTMEEK